MAKEAVEVTKEFDEFLDGIQDGEPDDHSQDAANEKNQSKSTGNPDFKPKADDTDEQQNADSAKPPVEDAEPEDINTRLKKMEEENRRLDKRFKETQADWTRKNQALIEAQKQLEEMKAKITAKAGGGAEDDDDDGTSYMTPKERRLLKEQADKIDRIAQRLEETSRTAAVKEWEAKEATFKQGKDDYDEVVDQFQRRWENDETLKKEFANAGATPEAAYKIGKRLQDLDEMAKDPEAYKEKLKEQLRSELEGNGQSARSFGVKPLARVASKPPKGNMAIDEPSPLSEVLHEINMR